MTFFALVFVNLRRHPLRTFVGVAGAGVGVAAMLAAFALAGGTVGLVERTLAADSHFLVYERAAADLFFSGVTAPQLAGLRALPQTQSAQPMIVGLVSAPGHPLIACFGLEAGHPRLTQVKWLAGSAADFGRRKNGVWLGARTAKFLDAAMSDSIEIGRGKFIVAGIFESDNAFENGGVILPLAAAQEFFQRESVASVVAVQLRNPAQGEAFTQAVGELYPGLSVVESGAIGRNFPQFQILPLSAWAIGAGAFLLGALVVANVMNLSVAGRTRELAALRVCGFAKSRIAALIFGEASAIALLGLAVGLPLGLGALAILPRVPQLHGYFQGVVAPPLIAGVAVATFISALTGAFWPARRAARIQPAEALRHD